MLKFLRYIVLITVIIPCFNVFANQNPYPEFNKYVKAFTYEQIYCKSDFSPEGLKLIKHYFKYAVSICNSDSVRLISDPKMQEAYQYYLNQAKKGNGEAAYKIGVATLMSFGIDKKNKEKCFKWFRKSARLNYLIGITTYADIIQSQPIDIHKMEAKRYDLYLKAAKSGSPIAYVYLIPTYVYRKNNKSALYWLKKARKLNYLNSPELVAMDVSYNFGGGLIQKNEPKAVSLLRRILNYKNAGIKTIQVSLRILGQCYLDGTGVKKDLNQAYYYYNQAALLIDNYAQSKLGDMYCHGLGVKKDQEKANYWHHLAWQHGYPNKVCK